MTRDDIIQWAKEAGFRESWLNLWCDNFESFAALVAADARTAERVAIANMIEHGDCPKCVDPGCGHGIQIGGPARRAYAATIRARTDTT